MKEASENVLSGSVTYAVRDTHFNGSEIHEGDIMGLMDGEIVEVGQSVDTVALNLLCNRLKRRAKNPL